MIAETISNGRSLAVALISPDDDGSLHKRRHVRAAYRGSSLYLGARCAIRVARSLAHSLAHSLALFARERRRDHDA